jgi:hypothetical protein
MSWIPDSNWLNVLKLKTSAAVVFICFGALGVAFARLQLFGVDALGKTGEAVFALSVVFGVSLLIGRAIDLWPRLSRARERRRVVNRHLDALPADSRRILSYLVTTNTKSFVAPSNCPRLHAIIHSRLIEQGQGGTLDEKPHFVPDNVWTALRWRRGEFFTDQTNEVPWARRYDPHGNGW